ELAGSRRFPSTTLFRSKAPMRMAEARLTLAAVAARGGELEHAVDMALSAFTARRRSLPQLLLVAREVGGEVRARDPQGRIVAGRSEEHTSELQAREDLV